MCEYIVRSLKNGEIESFNTLEEAQGFIERLKIYDKKYNIKDYYYIDIYEK